MKKQMTIALWGALWGLAGALLPPLRADLISEYTILAPPDASSASVTSLNNFNQAAGSYATAVGFATRGFIYSGDYSSISDPNAWLDGGPFIQGINDNGLFVGNYYTQQGAGYTGFVHDSTGYSNLLTPTGGNADPLGINNAGVIAGSYFDNGLHGFIRNGQNWTTIDNPASSQDTYVLGINNLNQVVGQYSDLDGIVHGFLWNGTSFTELDDPAAQMLGTYVQGLNDVGDVVGYYYDSAGYTHGFLWNSGNWITLDINVPDMTGTMLYGINNSGSMVGQFIDDSGGHSFLATPEPGTATTAVIALFVAISISRVRRVSNRVSNITEPGGHPAGVRSGRALRGLRKRCTPIGCMPIGCMPISCAPRSCTLRTCATGSSTGC